MRKFQCVECLKINTEKMDKCIRCGSEKILFEEKNNLLYKNLGYTKKAYEEEVDKLIGLSDNRVYYRVNEFEFSRQYLYKYVLRNIKKNTFLKIFLPCIGALLLAVFVLIVAIIIKLAVTVLPNEITNALVYFAIAIQIISILITIYFVYKDYKVIKYFDENEFKFQFLDKITYRYLKDNLYNEGAYFSFRPLESKRLTIREFNDSDVESYYELFSNENVHRFLFTKALKDRTDAIEDIDNLIKDYMARKSTRFAIVLRETDKVIGYVGLSKIEKDPKSAQIIYAVGEKYWGQGYTPEAVSSFVRWLIKSGKTDIYATRLEENVYSGKVLEKCGFIRNTKKDVDLMSGGVLRHVIGYSYPLGGKQTNEKN